MTDKVREATIDAIKKTSQTKAEIARDLQMDRQYLADLLNGKSGNAPKRYVQLLDYLGLELYVKPKGDKE